MTWQRRSFDPGFKLEVVKMIKGQGLSVQHISQPEHEYRHKRHPPLGSAAR